jgi:xanthosine utilization system XapX-like protein
MGEEDPDSWIVEKDGQPWATIPAPGALAMVGAAEVYFGYVISGSKPSLSEGKPIRVKIMTA